MTVAGAERTPKRSRLSAAIVVLALSAVLTAATHLPVARALSKVDGQAVRVAASACWFLVAAGLLTARAQSRFPGRSRGFWFTTACGLLWTVLQVVRMLLPAGTGLAANYYANTEWSGTPSFVVVDLVPDERLALERWTSPHPAAFSVLWTGYVTSRAGTYRFSTTSDDGSWLFIDGALVVDNGGVHGAQARNGDVTLSEGAHRVVLKYAQLGGGARLRLSWARTGETLRAVPSGMLSRRRAEPRDVWIAQALDRCLLALSLLVAIGGLESVARTLVAAVASVERLALRHYRGRAALWVSVAVYGIFLWAPRSDAKPLPFIVGTVRGLGAAVVESLRHPSTFRHNLDTPRAGERPAVPEQALEVAALLERHRLEHYRLSAAFVQNDWLIQQTVASAWPRTLEPDADSLFVWGDDLVPAACVIVDRMTEVALARCH